MALFSSRVPLAWTNLAHRPLRFAVFLAGIGFAVLLMFVQLGFWGALLDSQTALIRRMRGELVLINRAKISLAFDQPFPLQRLEQARAVPGVAGVQPVYIRMGAWKTPDRPTSVDPLRPPLPSQQLIRVVAFDPASGVLAVPGIAGYARALREAGTALIDTQSKPAYGVRAGEFRSELNGQSIRILGTYTLGTDFAANGNLIMDRQSYAQYFGVPGEDPLQEVEVGVVFLRKGADPTAVRAALARALPDDVLVLTRDDYVSREKKYWQDSTPVGFIFLLGLIVGFVVGVIICSQILSSDVADHLSEYATLKAIGYTNGYLTGVILQESLWLSVLAFVPGWLLSRLVYYVLESLTGLPMELTLGRSLAILLFTILMCVISGLVAVGKVWVADPAEVF